MPEPQLAAQFADLRSLVARQMQRGDRAAATFRLAGRLLEITAPPDVLPAVAEPLGHLDAGSGEAHLTWHLVRRDAEFARHVPARFTWDRQRYDDGQYEFRVDHQHGGIAATDRRASASVLVASDLDPDVWRRPESSRPFLERLLAAQGLVSVHGGTIGTRTHGILVTAPGGRGKSSLVAGAVRAGWHTTGDDFLCLEGTRLGPVLHSMYRTVKVAPDSPAWRDGMATGLLSDGPDGKYLTLLDADRPGCLVPSHVPVALVVPRPGARVALTPIEHPEAVAALVPSSVAMATDRASAVRSLSALAYGLPCFALTLARDPHAELAALAGLLAEHPIDDSVVPADPNAMGASR